MGRSADPDVLVVGSGLPALATALALARRRARVRLLHPPGAADHSSGLGLAAPGTTRPYDRIARELGHDAARTLWGAGRENLAMLRAFVEQSGRDCGLTSRGSFLLASDRPEAASLAESEDMLRDDGFPGEFLDHYMLESRFDLPGFAGAYWAADGGELDLPALGRALAAAARAAGAVLVPADVLALESDRESVIARTTGGLIHAASGVLATDGEARHLLPGLDVVLRPAAPTRLRCVPEPGASLPTGARTVDGRVAWVLSGPAFTIGATGPADPGDDFRLRGIVSRLPFRSREGLADEPGEVTADGLPIVGVLPDRPIAVACGFGALAASFALVAADWLAEALVYGRDRTPAPLRPRAAPAV